MSVGDTSIADIQKHLQEATECCICANTYKSPRILPCIHSFCLKCLEDTGASLNKCPGEKMSCPVCRKQFIIPLGGFVDLQHDFKVESLVEMSTKVESVTLCDLHAKKQLEIYCTDCTKVLCALCYISAHKTHNGVDVRVAADGFRQHIQKSIRILETHSNEAKQKQKSLAKKNEDFLLDFGHLEASVRTAKKELLRIVNKEAACLLAKAESLKKSQTDLILEELKQVNEKTVELKDLVNFSLELLRKGSAFVCIAFEDLDKRMTAKCKTLQLLTVQETDLTRYEFKQTNMSDILGNCNILGEIHELGKGMTEPSNNDLRRQIQTLERELKTKEAKVSELTCLLESKTQELAEETAFLGDALVKNTELTEYMEKLEDKCQEHQDFTRKMQLDFDNKVALMSNTIEQLSNDVAMEREINLKLAAKLNEIVEANDLQKTDLETKFYNLNQEAQKDKSNLREFQSKFDKLKHESDQKRVNKKDAYSQIIILKQQLEHKGGQINESVAEIEALNRVIHDLIEENIQLKASLTDTNTKPKSKEDVSCVLATKDTNFNQRKWKKMNTSSLLNELKQKSSELDLLLVEVNKLERLLEVQKEECSKLKIRNAKLEQMVMEMEQKMAITTN